VSALMPCERRSGSRSGNRADGKPFFRQCETVFGLVFVARANAKVPPMASIISEAVLSGVMGRTLSASPAIVKSAKYEIVPVVSLPCQCG
jgi:hypothetical protein